jgi:hypothetical protein
MIKMEAMALPAGLSMLSSLFSSSAWRITRLKIRRAMKLLVFIALICASNLWASSCAYSAALQTNKGDDYQLKKMEAIMCNQGLANTYVNLCNIVDKSDHIFKDIFSFLKKNNLKFEEVYHCIKCPFSKGRDFFKALIARRHRRLKRHLWPILDYFSQTPERREFLKEALNARYRKKTFLQSIDYYRFKWDRKHPEDLFDDHNLAIRRLEKRLVEDFGAIGTPGVDYGHAGNGANELLGIKSEK